MAFEEAMRAVIADAAFEKKPVDTAFPNPCLCMNQKAVADAG